MARRPTKAKVEAPPPVDDTEPTAVIALDTTLADAEEPELLPQGFYLAEIQDVQIQMNQKGTGKYFQIKWVIPVDQFPAGYDPENAPDGVTLFYNLLSVPKGGDRRALSRLRGFYEKIGLNTNITEIDVNEWMNASAKLKIKHRTWEGEQRAEIAANGIEEAD